MTKPTDLAVQNLRDLRQSSIHERDRLRLRAIEARTDAAGFDRRAIQCDDQIASYEAALAELGASYRKVICVSEIDERTLETIESAQPSERSRALDDQLTEPPQPVPIGPPEAIEFTDLRVGQIIELFADYRGIIRELGPEEQLPVFIALADKNGEFPEHWNVQCGPEEISRVVEQPEDRMPLEEAKKALEELEAHDFAKDGPLSPLDHKRRILLHRRIEQLEQEQAP